MRLLFFISLFISSHAFGQRDTMQYSDTAKVIMLMCDTTTVGEPDLKFVLAKWRYGYKVKTIYLDKYKKPLSKNLVVWQSIEIKKINE